MKIRLVEEKDYQRVLDILNDAIEKRIYTAQLRKAIMEERQSWFIQHTQPKQPMFVIEAEGEVMGWIALTEFRAGREGFRFTSEISYYMDPKAQGKGYGKMMMGHAIEAAREIGFRSLIAVIFESNYTSENLARKFGFELWGRLPDVVDIDGKIVGCDYWVLKL